MSIRSAQLQLPWRVPAGTPSRRTLLKRAKAARVKTHGKADHQKFLYRKGFTR